MATQTTRATRSSQPVTPTKSVPDSGEPSKLVPLITYLSATEDYRSVLLDHLSMADADATPRGEFQIHFRQPGPGALQGSVSLSPAEALYRLLFGLATMLGHSASVIGGC